MDLQNFIQTLITEITRGTVDGIQKAPPKVNTVMRAGGKIQTTSLPQLMAELSDQMIISNNLKREELKQSARLIELLEENIEAVDENTKVGEEQLKIAKSEKPRRRRERDEEEP